MSVRQGGSYLLDPVTGELTPNLPAEPEASTNSREGRSGTAREAPSAGGGPTEAPASAPVGGTQSAAPNTTEASAAAEAQPAEPIASTRRRAPQKEA